MPRFFLDYIVGDHVTIVGEDAKHIIKSLRMKVGDEVSLSNQQGVDYNGKISTIATDSVQVDIVERVENQTEPDISITLYQALPKSDKLEFIMQKIVEIGAVKMVPVLTSRCISRPKEGSMDKKIQRLEKISLEAAKQSFRGIVPAVGGLLSFQQALGEMKKTECGILFYENATDKLSTLIKHRPKKIAVMVGAEGGFSPEEIALAKAAGIGIASLGNRILRCETAPIVGLSALFYAAGEF